MKIKLMKKTEKVLNVQIRPNDTPARIVNVLHNKTKTETEFLSAILAFKYANPEFDLKEAITTPHTHGAYEYVVRCVMYSRYKLLDYIFDNEIVSPNFIASNGSPLVLFAMQNSVEMFSYLISRGAHLLDSGDLVHNKLAGTKHVTCLFASHNFKKVRDVLLNFVVVNRTNITNVKTLQDCLNVGITNGRPIEHLNLLTNRISALQYKETVEQRAQEIENKMLALKTLISSGTQPREQIFLDLVSNGCDDYTHFAEAGKGLPEYTIISGMHASLGHNSLDTYYSMCRAFPYVRIQ